ncbi:hypothetical protein Dimus_027894 [Dionaea muscipula]
MFFILIQLYMNLHFVMYLNIYVNLFILSLSLSLYIYIYIYLLIVLAAVDLIFRLCHVINSCYIAQLLNFDAFTVDVEISVAGCDTLIPTSSSHQRDEIEYKSNEF